MYKTYKCVFNWTRSTSGKGNKTTWDQGEKSGLLLVERLHYNRFHYRSVLLEVRGLYELILYVSEGLLSKLLCSHNVGMKSFDLHGLILCVPEGYLSELLCIHNVYMGTFDLHGLIWCESEGLFSKMLWIHNVGMESFDLHGLILCVSEGVLSQ